MAEVTNNMFNRARDMNWLDDVDYILTKMMQQISIMRKENELYQGIVP
jgi:hypothetical protein